MEKGEYEYSCTVIITACKLCLHERKDYSHGELKLMSSDKRVMENILCVVPFIFFNRMGI